MRAPTYYVPYIVRACMQHAGSESELDLILKSGLIFLKGVTVSTKMNPVSLSTNESLKSKILRRVREEEKQLSPEMMDTSGSGHRMSIRGQSSLGDTRQKKSRKPCLKSRSLRSSSRTQLEIAHEPNSKTLKTPKRTQGNGGRARAKGAHKSQVR